MDFWPLSDGAISNGDCVRLEKRPNRVVGVLALNGLASLFIGPLPTSICKDGGSLEGDRRSATVFAIGEGNLDGLTDEDVEEMDEDRPKVGRSIRVPSVRASRLVSDLSRDSRRL